MTRTFSVLLVEDNDPLRLSLREVLDARGCRTYSTDQTAEALEMARRIHLDFGILDLHLPGGTGLELFETITREIGPMPAIMMSGEATPLETEAALQAGVFTFLRKPIAIQQLQSTVDRLIQQHFPPPAGDA